MKEKGHDYFISLNKAIKDEKLTIPNQLLPYQADPDPICRLSADLVQHYLKTQTEWKHNFGLEPGQEGAVIGKMFGVLVVETKELEIGFLAAYSGKLAGGYPPSMFVPPVYDGLKEGSFLNLGMSQLTQIGHEIKDLENINRIENRNQILLLKELRKKNSIALQEAIFDQYHFLNWKGETKNLKTIFSEYSNSKPPSGAGECTAPKLIQFAYKNEMKPLSMAEFWWGLSPKSDHWQHRKYYPACKEKCEPILNFMLGK